MPKVVVLGAGMVGSVMAADFAAEPGWSVTIADARAENLATAVARCQRAASGAGRTAEVAAIEADLSQPAEVRRVVAGADLVMGALASRVALGAMRAVIEAGRNFCDISFMAEDAMQLDALAKQHGVTCVVDCGVAPGMSHMLATLGASQLDKCERVAMYVGGLPRERRWPFEYKAGFSPADVLEEYTRPARLVRGGKLVVAEALSEPELMDFDGIGTLEAFNTDGLRSLIGTHGPGAEGAGGAGGAGGANGRRAIPEMVEKTLRYPGHIELMRVLRAMGLMGEVPVRVGNGFVVPREVTAALMFPMWTYQPGEEDLTVMRVLAEGVAGGEPTRVTYDLLDFYHRPSMSTSMARTTALPAAIVGRLIHAGRVRGSRGGGGGGGGGVIVPEELGYESGVMAHVLEQLHARGVVYTKSVRALDSR